MRRIRLILAAALGGALLLLTLAVPPARAQAAPTAQTYLRLADEVDAHLKKQILDLWYPRCVEPGDGGFHAAYDRQWKALPNTGYFTVFQARMTWVAATVVLRRPALKDQYLTYVIHGLHFLDSVMWDKTNGGFYSRVLPDHQPDPEMGAYKALYAQAFGIYAAAAAYEATKDPQALDLAKRAFAWLDAHDHDAVHGGYFDVMDMAGQPVRHDPASARVGLAQGVWPIGYKSMNAHIHLLEAYTQLYHAWPDAAVKNRLNELVDLVSQHFYAAPGCLNQYLTADLQPIPDCDSFGHDIETSYLLLEAAGELGRAAEPQLQLAARLLTDHTIDYGYDARNGGVYGRGYALSAAFGLEKDWWTQDEAMNSLLMMHQLYGSTSQRYWPRFLQTWNFISTKMTDPEYGGRYGIIEANGTAGMAKGSDWKAAYHDARALLNVADRLRALARQAGGGSN